MSLPPPEKRLMCNIYFLLDDIQKTVKNIDKNLKTEKIEFIRGIIKSMPPNYLMKLSLEVLSPTFFDYIKERDEEKIYEYIDDNFLEFFNNSLPSLSYLVLSKEDINEIFYLIKKLFKIIKNEESKMGEFDKNYYYKEFGKIMKIISNYCKDDKNNIPKKWKGYDF